MGAKRDRRVCILLDVGGSTVRGARAMYDTCLPYYLRHTIDSKKIASEITTIARLPRPTNLISALTPTALPTDTPNETLPFDTINLPPSDQTSSREQHSSPSASKQQASSLRPAQILGSNAPNETSSLPPYKSRRAMPRTPKRSINGSRVQFDTKTHVAVQLPGGWNEDFSAAALSSRMPKHTHDNRFEGGSVPREYKIQDESKEKDQGYSLHSSLVADPSTLLFTSLVISQCEPRHHYVYVLDYYWRRDSQCWRQSLCCFEKG